MRSEKKPTKFKSTISLAETNATRDRDNAQFLRLIVVVTCLSLIGWMPQYVTTFLSLSHMYVSGTVLFIVHWSTYLKAVLCPIMYLVCCSEYRQVVRYSMRRIKKSICPCLVVSEKKSQSITLSENVQSVMSVLQENENIVLHSFSRSSIPFPRS